MSGKDTLIPGIPARLFDLIASARRPDFLVATDGQRFLVPGSGTAPRSFASKSCSELARRIEAARVDEVASCPQTKTAV
jgi:hypothetical protein